MSFNQSRSDKNDSQFRNKPGRSNPQRTSSSGSYAKGGPPAPSPLSSSSGSNNRSFKKTNHHGGGGGQSRVNLPPVNSSDSAPRTVQNGAPLHGASNAPGSFGTAKPVETNTANRSSRPIPKAPTSQPPTLTPPTSSSLPPVSSTGDAGKEFSFQFGSLGPTTYNGMQIPARTSSAPPNLDEQKREQARHEAFRSGPPLPIPVPKQQIPRNDRGIADHSTAGESKVGEARPLPKPKKDVLVSTQPPVSQTHKSPVIPMSMTSVQMSFPQPPVSMQFGGPQIQSQGLPSNSLQVPMQMAALSMGNSPQVQQPMFVQSLPHPHPMQAQGMMHQGQGLNFTAQMGPQLAPQLGNLGIGISSQYSQQQGGKYGGPRKSTIKITDPKTHEELRLDKRTDSFADGGSAGLRSHPNVPPQSQQIPSFAQLNYYSNSYNPNHIYFPPNSLPLTTGQLPPNPQQLRYNYSVGQGPQNVPFVNPPAAANSQPISSTSTSTATVQMKVKPISSSTGGHVSSSTEEKAVDSLSLSASSSSAVEKGVSSKPSRSFAEVNSSHTQKDSENVSESSSLHTKLGSESLASKQMAARQPVMVSVDGGLLNSSTATRPVESAAAESNTENKRKETLSRSNSVKDQQKKAGKKGHSQSQNQIGGQSGAVSSTPRPLELDASSRIGNSDSIEIKVTSSASAASIEALIESVPELIPTIAASTSDLPESKFDDSGEHCSSISAQSIADTAKHAHQAPVDGSSLQEHPKCEIQGTEDQVGKGSVVVPMKVDKKSEILSESVTSQSTDLLNECQKELSSTDTALGNEISTLEPMREGLGSSETCHTENIRKIDDIDVTSSRNMDSEVGKFNETTTDAASSNNDISDTEVSPVLTADLSEATSKGDVLENSGSISGSVVVSSSKEKAVELTRSKSTTSKLKKKRKEILQKADAAGSTYDLYMAYKGPEERKENAAPESTSSSNLKQEPSDATRVDLSTSEKCNQIKTEPDDWEDAADISTPKLETLDSVERGYSGTTKKYSRDFLLKFAEQCTDLPERFEITADVADALISGSASYFVEQSSYPSPGRTVDRSNSGSRLDRRGGGMVDDDRWSKLPGPFGMGRDLRLDIGFGGNASFRPGQGANFGVLRNPRAQSPGQYAGGILTGPMQSMGPQGVMQRNSPDAERWQRATNFQQRGLIPSPQTPLQMMHKAERKYEVGKVTDEEEAKQRRLKAILNKLTPQNFEKLFEQVKEVNIDNAVTLTGVISQIFDKALMEPTFCEMYANFCHHLAGELPDFTEDNEKITFKRLLLNKCQEEFERGEREEEEANKADEEGEAKQSEEEREEKRTKARRRMLGNIRLIGELYKKKMLTERIMHECIKKLLGQYQNPDEEDVEALCKLMSTIGEMIDHPKAKEHMDAYFDRMTMLSNNMKLSSRVRFMLKDAIDLRKNKWQQRRKVEGPKKIDEVHRDAAQERHHQSSRLSRNPSMNPSPRRATMDFGPRASAMLSPNPQMSGYPGLATQVRGYGTQDIRFEERQSYEARTLSVPLPRSLGDDSITLGPQGGLARGMSFRGPSPMTGPPVADTSPSLGESRRMAVGLNGFSSVPERPAFSPRDEYVQRFPERCTVSASFDQSGVQERNMNYLNREPRSQDRIFDRPHAMSPPGQAQVPAFTQNIPSEKVWSEERLREMSMAAIKEFYSARDEKEVALCIKELNSASFHPSMISLWVTDSFERKDMERDLLAKLLVNLARSTDAILTPQQLVKGFESVLVTLEDAVNDAPRAAEFLGRMLAKAVLENVLALIEIGQLLQEGGEEPGRLLEIGLAGDVLGSTLEIIRAERGESGLKEIRKSSNIRLEDFQPPAPNKSRILEKFI